MLSGLLLSSQGVVNTLLVAPLTVADSYSVHGKHVLRSAVSTLVQSRCLHSSGSSACQLYRNVQLAMIQGRKLATCLILDRK